MTKVRKCISIDEDLDSLAKIKLGMPLSTFINNVLKETLNSPEDLSEIEDKISFYEKTIAGLRVKRCKLEKEKRLQLDEESNYGKCMITINRIHDHHGMVGENQILNVASNYGLDHEKLIVYCRELGLNVVKGFEPDRINKSNKEGTGYALR